MTDQTVEKNGRKPNKLINEKSPYLLQHAYNPVNWYPWGEEAFEKARKEDKPIILSIGYSTCHWCHVMEKESFSNPMIAGIMNENFVCIKVDREEHPDIDRVYMTAVTAMSGSGGWPLNVFLTPELKPIFGGTYYPPRPRTGIMAWPDLLRRISEVWNNPPQKKQFIDSANQITQSIRNYLNRELIHKPYDDSLLTRAVHAFNSVYDPEKGGFSNAPKFPVPVISDFLMFFSEQKGIENDTEKNRAKTMAHHTLVNMAKGGIYDQIGGGFHRYSTDASWHVPHFEKMLYDNAQLIPAYLKAYTQTKEPLFADIARETADYLLDEMVHPDGGFYSAQDADSVPADADTSGPKEAEELKEEGAFYVWKIDQVSEVLKNIDTDVSHETLLDIVCYHYGIKPEGNAQYDPHGEFTGKNILFVAHTIAETGKHFDISLKKTEDLIHKAKQALFGERSKRPRPHLDDKILTSWNGLTISAMARACQVLDDKTYLFAAQKAARFIRENLYEEENNRLYRRWRDGERNIPGTSEDYSFMVQGLIDLYESDFDPQWLKWAFELSDTLIRRFFDTKNGGFFMSEAGEEDWLPVRAREDTDTVTPSASSVGVLNLLRLSRYSDRHRERFWDRAQKTIKAFVAQMEQNPGGSALMLTCTGCALSPETHIVIDGDPDSENTRSMLSFIRYRFDPRITVMLIDGEETRNRMLEELPFIESMKRIDNKATAYLCSGRSCKEPVTDVNDLASYFD